MGVAAAALLAEVLTPDEWADLDEDVSGELVDGVLTEEERPDNTHETVVVWLAFAFHTWLGKRGFVFGSEAKYGVRAARGRKPDVSVFLPGGTVPPRRGLNRLPPDIVVEVVSPSPKDGRRDRIEKPEDYAAFGVRWYWIVDPGLRTLEIFELGADGRYVSALGATDGTVTTPGCDGLTLDLSDLWSEIDRLNAEEGEGEAST